jgi:Asp-tRNA(Asn)/Glu-tRNA(Gln) amidotransferase A subunit family amidase
MNPVIEMSARELASRMARRELSAESVMRAFVEHIETQEPLTAAWQFFDPEVALRQARQCDQQSVAGVLHGLPVGIKDLMDTIDMPTTYGSPIYAGHRPAVDAACVAQTRSLGGIVMGKTVTTEFATFQPGATRNPRAAADAPRTPGGSSSGSAAAVAAGMVPLAFGTQTAGSIIRPASYCGVVGYKPTHGTLPLAGIKPLSPSLDTLGVLARSVDDAAFFIGALARLSLAGHAPGHIRVGLCRTPHWDLADADARAAFANAGRLLERAGAAVIDISLPATFESLAQTQIDIMGYEGAANFAPEANTSADGFSPAFAAFLAAGRAIDGDRYFAAQARTQLARQAFDLVFDSVDVLLAPSAQGEAPHGIGATGDPILNRMWTVLGNPCVHVPVGTGATGMPVGVTVIGPRFGDAWTLAAASVLEQSAA